ncbi:alpha/beta hydrolase [Exilibacterium tricleocarpae]|uniref:Alpha/beta hydrolase n=1 Tax=Exilibacterium tricleocarpae TaxID=2591008 RepID=A0A545TVR2_9GAMM|nr:alpha/beta hydrolase [Exilibacterium tricleocarpae]TQV81303.1 alpha/beta hydrolase [Exilibacterium tricleocarpae]
MTGDKPLISVDTWKAHGEFTRLRGYEIFYMDTHDHDKPTVLLIHGFPTASWDWTKIWPGLAQHYRLVAMDLLGFGFSDKPDPHTYSIMEQADLCEGLIEKLQLGRFHVLAHDYGDTVAQELLARQNAGTGSGNWLSVCFLNGGLFPETHRARLIQKLLLSPLGPLINRVLSKPAFERSMNSVFGPDTKATRDELDGFWQLINTKNGKHLFHNLITYIRDRRQHRERWLEALRDSAVPLGLINGSVDPVSGAHMVARFEQLVGNNHFIRALPAIGHYPQVEAPEQVLEAYTEFLQRLSTAEPELAARA